MRYSRLPNPSRLCANPNFLFSSKSLSLSPLNTKTWDRYYYLGDDVS
jgi:hypothetical protein